MHKPELSRVFMDQAQSDIPRQWYESNIVTGLTMLASLAVVDTQEFLLPINHAAELLGGVALYGMSVIADRVTTRGTLRASDAAREQGIETHIVEQSPIVGRVRTLDDYDKSVRRKRVIAGETALFGLACLTPVVSPALGIAAAMGRFKVSATNHRLGRRVNRAIDISNNLPK